MSIRYTPTTGESVCMSCGELVHQSKPIKPLWCPPPASEYAASLTAMQLAVEAHRCGQFTDWQHAALVATLPHEFKDVVYCAQLVGVQVSKTDGVPLVLRSQS